MKSEKFTRWELYELVWRESLPSLAKKYDISYNDLRKLCIVMDIPLPKAGYWQNLWLGKQVRIERLPESSEVQQECTLNLLEEGDVRTEKPKRAAKVLKEQLEHNSEVKFSVPAKLSKPDGLIEAARKDMAQSGPWRFGHAAGLVTCSRNILDIAVAPGNVARALRFMDAFIKLIRSRGHDIIVEDGKTYAVLEGEKVKVSIKEKSKRFVIEKPNGSEDSEYKPTGVLSFKMVIFYKDTEWKDSKLPLEDQLAIILSTMEVKAKEHKEEMARWHREAEEREEERKAERAEEEQKAKELKAFQQLLEEAQIWHRFDTLRRYIDKVEERALAKSGGSEDLNTWLTWARKMVEAHDPLNNDYKPYF